MNSTYHYMNQILGMSRCRCKSRRRAKYENWQTDRAQQVHSKRRVLDGVNDGSDYEVMNDVPDNVDSSDVVMEDCQE